MKKIKNTVTLHEAAVSIRMDAFSQLMSEHGWMCFVNEMRGGWRVGEYYSIILRYHEPSYVYFTHYMTRLFIKF
jgi:hypothetical protein